MNREEIAEIILWLLLAITISISFNHLWDITMKLTNSSTGTILAEINIEIILALFCAVGLAFTKKNLKNRSFTSKNHIRVSFGQRQIHFIFAKYSKLLFGILVFVCILNIVLVFLFFESSILKLFEFWTQNSQHLNYTTYYIIGQLPFLFANTPTIYLMLLSEFWLLVLLLLLSRIKFSHE